MTVASGESFAANRDRVAWQTETRSDRRKRMEFCNALIAKKIEGCIQTLETSLRRSYAWDRAMKRARDDLARLANDPPQTVDELRLLEAQSAVAYFRAWHATSLLWRASARHPIPDEWRTVGPRYSRVYASGSRNASHPVNAILNYAYAVLQSQVQIKAVADGYDPMLGIMHYDRDGAPAFVFDMMEPERPKVDRAVLGVPQIGGVASGGFHDPRGWGGEAQSGVGEAGGCFSRGVELFALMILTTRFPVSGSSK